MPKPISILVVDDEPDMQPLFEQRFRKERKAGLFAFQFARSGEAALAMLQRTEHPDIVFILSDIQMPGMHGLTLLEKIKDRFPAIKVFMITAFGNAAQRQEADALGADAWLTKPLDFDDLKARLLEDA